MSFNYQLVKDILVCPITRDDLVHEENALVSVNPERRLSYPIVDGIPRLLVDEAQELSQQEWSEVMKRHDRDGVTGKPI